MDEFSIRLFNRVYYGLGGFEVDNNLIIIKK